MTSMRHWLSSQNFLYSFLLTFKAIQRKEGIVLMANKKKKPQNTDNKTIFCTIDDTTYYLNECIKGDTIEILKTFPDKSIDTIFADPPYFMQSTDKILQRADGTGEFKGCDDAWDKYKDYVEYDNFCNDWLKECKRVLKDDGTIWVIGSFQNIFRLGYLMQNLGFWILNDVVWNKTNPTPNMAGTRFCNAHETLLWCSKGKNNKFTFNYKTMKYLNDNKQDKSVWTLGICQGNERLKGNDGKKLHTTQKPEALLEKIILSSTKPNDIVLDPFFGTGTTGAVAKKYGRNFIGIEREQTYIDGAEARIQQVQNQSNDISNLILEVKPPRYSLSDLIKLKLIKENEFLYDREGNKKCTVCRDGKVRVEEEITSIHKLSAKLLNKNNHNGWDYFYIKKDEKLISIDDLRYQAKEMEGN